MFDRTTVTVVHPLLLRSVEARTWIFARIVLIWRLSPSGLSLSEGLHGGGPELALHVIETVSEGGVVRGTWRTLVHPKQI